MFEITIKDLETGEVRTKQETRGLVVLCIRQEGEKDTCIIHQCSVDDISNVFAGSAELRSAARLGLAKYEARKDMEEEEGREKAYKLFKALNALKDDE